MLSYFMGCMGWCGIRMQAEADVCWCYVVVWLGWCGIRMQAEVCWCYVVVWLGWCGIRMQAEAVLQPASYQCNTTHEITQQISRKLLRMDVLTSETC